MSETIHHPSHYNQGGIEVFQIIDEYRLDFYLGNAVKYLCRAGRKDPMKEVEDLKKALEYIEVARDVEAWHPMVHFSNTPRISIDQIIRAFNLEQYRAKTLESVLRSRAVAGQKRYTELTIAKDYAEMAVIAAEQERRGGGHE